MKKTALSLLLLFSLVVHGQKTIFWKVTTPTSQYVAYLLGTNHLFGESFIDSFPIIKEKLNSTNVIVTELYMDREKIAAYYNTRPSSDTLASVLSKEDLNLVTDIFKNGKGKTDIRKFSPGEIFLKLQALYPKYKCGLLNKADTLSMDDYVQYLGKQGQKELYYLETDSFQIKALADASNMIDWKFFKKNTPALLTKYRAEDSNKNLCSLTNDYAAFNIGYNFDKPCNLMNNTNSNDILIIKRNEDWMKKIPELLTHKNVFIAVGLGHFMNKCGLIEQLRNIGYTVEPVEMK